MFITAQFITPQLETVQMPASKRIDIANFWYICIKNTIKAIQMDRAEWKKNLNIKYTMYCSFHTKCKNRQNSIILSKTPEQGLPVGRG